MPRGAVYVSDNDQELFEQAIQKTGGLSPVITVALKEYMARARLCHEGMSTIDLTIDDYGASHTVRFTNRKLSHLAEKADNGARVRSVYVTKQGQYAIHEKITANPENWEGQGERLQCDPVTWTHSFWLCNDRTLDILDILNQLRKKDPRSAGRIAAAQEVSAFRELDIQALLRRPRSALLPDASGPGHGTGSTSIRKKYTDTHYPGP